MKNFFFGVIFGCFITTHWDTISSVPSWMIEGLKDLWHVQWCVSAIGNQDEICEE